jgi:peptidoglycan/xylan/chitin deacetylase (PgdA/CDA1 family)
MQRFVNLTFHGIGDSSRALEKGEADVWVSRRDFLSLLDGAACRDDVRITFDDGNASDLEHALPALSDRGLIGTFFVVAGRLGERGFLRADDVRTLADAGMAIGSHGMWHRPWRELDEHDLQDELAGARQILEAVVERPVTEAACPFGSYDRRVLRALRREGYSSVYTSDRGTAHARDWLQARNSVRGGEGPGLIDRIISADGSGSRVRRRVKLTTKRWR